MSNLGSIKGLNEDVKSFDIHDVEIGGQGEYRPNIMLQENIRSDFFFNLPVSEKGQSMKNEIVGLRMGKLDSNSKTLDIDKMVAKENQKLKKTYFSNMVTNQIKFKLEHKIESEQYIEQMYKAQMENKQKHLDNKALLHQQNDDIDIQDINIDQKDLNMVPQSSDLLVDSIQQSTVDVEDKRLPIPQRAKKYTVDDEVPERCKERKEEMQSRINKVQSIIKQGNEENESIAQ